MRTIYPPETLALLAECDEHINEVLERYQRLAKHHAEANIYVPVDWQRKVQEDSEYQAWTRQKAKIISVSPYALQFDANELKPQESKEPSRND